MQKASMLMIGSGAAIALGLALMAVGSQSILEGIAMDEKTVMPGSPVTLETELVRSYSPEGIYAIHARDAGGPVHVTITDPIGDVIESAEFGGQRSGEWLGGDGMWYQMSEPEYVEGREGVFEVGRDGVYQIHAESSGTGEVDLFMAIGPQPDSYKRALGPVSAYMVMAGMVGMVATGVYKVVQKRREAQFR